MSSTGRFASTSSGLFLIGLVVSWGIHQAFYPFMTWASGLDYKAPGNSTVNDDQTSFLMILDQVLGIGSSILLITILFTLFIVIPVLLIVKLVFDAPTDISNSLAFYKYKRNTQILFDQEQFAEAYINFRKIIELGGAEYPNNLIALNRLALMHERIGKYSKAIQYYELALSTRESTFGLVISTLFLPLPATILRFFRHLKNWRYIFRDSDKKLLIKSAPILFLASFLTFYWAMFGLSFFQRIFLPLFLSGLGICLISEIIQIWDKLYKKSQILFLSLTVPYALTFYFVVPAILAFPFVYLSIAKIRIERSNKQVQGHVLSRLGGLSLYLGQYQQANDYFERALNIAREIYDSDLEYHVLKGLGKGFFLLESHCESLEHLSQAKLLLSRIAEYPFQNSPEYGEILVNLGANYTKIDQYDQAFDYYKKALKIAFSQKSIFLKKLALLYQGIAHSELTGHEEKALTDFDQVLSQIEEIGVPEIKTVAMYHKALTMFRLGKSEEAIELLRDSILILEKLRSSTSKDAEKISIFENQAQAYQLLQQALVKQKQVEEALEISERSRARAFVELIMKGLVPLPQPQTDRFGDPVPNLTNAQLDSSGIQSLSLKDIINIANERQATLIEYSLAEKSAIYIWVILPNGEIHFCQKKIVSEDGSNSLHSIAANLPFLMEKAVQNRAFNRKVSKLSEAELLELGQETLDQANELKDTIENILKQLYQWLIDPIADKLPTDPEQQVVFIPEGALFSIPFCALQDIDGKYLIQKYSILTAPSIQALSLVSQDAGITEIKEALVVGNPTEDLSFAKEEAEMVAAQFNVEALLGPSATKAAVISQMSKADLMHFATHGQIDLETGLQSAIVLTSPNGGKDFLTAAEIYEMRLRAKLVVLSCCNTGQGRITSDGVIGLSRCFMKAGVRNLLLTQWSIPDPSTAFLMKAFYQKIQSSNATSSDNQLTKEASLNIALALREAMQETLASPNYSHPVNWAAFFLLGEAQRKGTEDVSKISLDSLHSGTE